MGCYNQDSFFSFKNYFTNIIQTKRSVIFVFRMCLYSVTFSKRECSECFPLLFLCFRESLFFPDSLLVSWIFPELCLFNFDIFEVSLGVDGCCSRRGFFLDFFLSRCSVELLELLQTIRIKRFMWSNSKNVKKKKKKCRISLMWGPTPGQQKHDLMRHSCFPVVVSSWELFYCLPWPRRQQVTRWNKGSHFKNMTGTTCHYFSHFDVCSFCWFWWISGL